MARHKHADLIHAWADGAEIQVLNNGKWIDIYYPVWEKTAEYRVKLQLKPDYVLYDNVSLETELSMRIGNNSNVRYTFDGETNKLKSVEVLK
jgi:hypothetical protein